MVVGNARQKFIVFARECDRSMWRSAKQRQAVRESGRLQCSSSQPARESPIRRAERLNLAARQPEELPKKNPPSSSSRCLSSARRPSKLSLLLLLKLQKFNVCSPPKLSRAEQTTVNSSLDANELINQNNREAADESRLRAMRPAFMAWPPLTSQLSSYSYSPSSTSASPSSWSCSLSSRAAKISRANAKFPAWTPGNSRSGPSWSA